MTDIVEKRGLRGPRCCVECQDDCGAAADEIERLRAAIHAQSDILDYGMLYEKAVKEIERLRALNTEMYNALQQMVTWMPSGFAPQSQDMAMRAAHEAMAKYAGKKVVGPSWA